MPSPSTHGPTARHPGTSWHQPAPRSKRRRSRRNTGRASPPDQDLLRHLVSYEYRSMVIRQLQITVEWQSIEWLDLAACREAAATQQTCRRCPVRAPCLAAAIAIDDPAGWRGGVTRDERSAYGSNSNQRSRTCVTSSSPASTDSSTVEAPAERPNRCSRLPPEHIRPLFSTLRRTGGYVPLERKSSRAGHTGSMAHHARTNAHSSGPPRPAP